MKFNTHYWKRYVKFVLVRLNRPKPDCYTEKHHIWPRCLGGTDLDNIVVLTAREHYIAHWILSKCFECQAKYKMLYAFASMQTNKHLTVKQYARAREANTNKRHTKKTKAKISESRKEGLANGTIKPLTGELNPMYGKDFSKEHRAKISKAGKGRKHSKETKAKMSASNKGKTRPFTPKRALNLQITLLQKALDTNCLGRRLKARYNISQIDEIQVILNKLKLELREL